MDKSKNDVVDTVLPFHSSTRRNGSSFSPPAALDRLEPSVEQYLVPLVPPADTVLCSHSWTRLPFPVST
jgi:hypothetical protein